MEDAHLLSDRFKMSHIDDCFTKCQEVLAARTEGKGRRDVSGSTWLSLQEFFVVLCWVAHAKFSPNMDSMSLDTQVRSRTIIPHTCLSHTAGSLCRAVLGGARQVRPRDGLPLRAPHGH
eukprot:1183362-Prorocentrum_minimum.AAC.1